MANGVAQVPSNATSRVKKRPWPWPWGGCTVYHHSSRRNGRSNMTVLNSRTSSVKSDFFSHCCDIFGNRSAMRSRPSYVALATFVAVLLVSSAVVVDGEYVRELTVSEGVPVGTRLGFISGPSEAESSPPYLIVPVPGSAVDSDLAIDEASGEIRTKVVLDREVRSLYSFVALPLSGENIRVLIRVLDENDNSPTFPHSRVDIEFPENSPLDAKRTLAPARDADLDLFNTQRYEILSGNVNDAFRLSSHREKDGVLYVDLQVNGLLDRETKGSYDILLAAFDGGSPPLNGTMTVHVEIQDVNDNQPIFNQSRYFATVPENATIGTSVLQVFATDTDTGNNALVTYSMNRRHSDRTEMFSIDPKTGVIRVNRPLDYETRDVHELVVVARDNGAQPLETTAFVSVRVLDVNDNQPTINLIFLSDDATPKISEDAQPGEFVARISVNDPDTDLDTSEEAGLPPGNSSPEATAKQKAAKTKAESSVHKQLENMKVNVTLEGGDGHFGLTTQDNIIYLVIVSKPLDREFKANYTLVVTATDQGTPPLHATRSFQLLVTDTNDNAPEFDQTIYYASVLEVADPGTSVFQLTASDRDQGPNSVVTYSIANRTADKHSHPEWFEIHPHTGLITTKTHIDCETDPNPKITVVAVDSGEPALSSSATVVISIRDVNDNEPIFDQSFYNVSVKENQPVGTCILQVSASDPDCGVNAMVNYTIGMERGFGKFPEFSVEPSTGQVCLAASLDREVRHTYEFPIVATDRGGLSTTAMVKVQVEDVNDNAPIFYPREYNVSLREGSNPTNAPVVVVVASDPDSGTFGTIKYKILGDDYSGLFRVHETTGEVFLTNGDALRRLGRQNGDGIRVNVTATDGGGLSALQPAQITLSIIGPNQKPPVFRHPRYSFEIPEDVPIGTQVGSVSATASNIGHGSVRYSVYNGDPNGYFTVDPVSGMISTKSRLDHETQPFVLLNIQAASGTPPSYGHTQVNITIGDVNDNPPEFDGVSVRISVPEDADTRSGVALYGVHAQDADDGANGRVSYRIVDGKPAYGLEAFRVDPQSGVVTLVKSLDHEKQTKYDLSVLATDHGTPPLSAYLQLRIDVQDVNDNGPVFQRKRYDVTVAEGLPMNAQLVQVEAEDADSGNNARMTYSIVSTKPAAASGNFGVFPNSGIIYLKGDLDREKETNYEITVLATDNGSPSRSSSTVIALTVADVNDNAPKFGQDVYQFTVEEGRKAGTVFGKVAATDPDNGSNATLSYALLHSNRTFVIDSRTGQLSIGTPLDRERQPVYELQVEARDDGSPPLASRATVRVLVTDINDNAPEFLGLGPPQAGNARRKLEVSVREQQPSGTQVTRIQAIDRDEGPNATISYRLKPSSAVSSGIFTIDSETGVIRTTKVLTHAEKNKYEVTVQVSDSGKKPLTSSLDLVVTILDLNDETPTSPSTSLHFQVSEDAPVATAVGYVGLTGVEGEENGFAIASGNEDGYFVVDPTNGMLVTTKPLDREYKAAFQLEVVSVDATDRSTSSSSSGSFGVIVGPRRNSVRIEVVIDDVNDNPPRFAVDPAILTVSESAPAGTIVGNVTATDPDSGPNGEIEYSVVSQWPAEHFIVDPSSGKVTVKQPLDYEIISEYTLVIEASDKARNPGMRLKSTQTVRLLVTDSNDHAPMFVAPLVDNVAVLEDEPVGYPLVHFRAIDGDAGENGMLKFGIASGNKNGVFRIDSETGLLWLDGQLDRETVPTYTLNVTVTDGASTANHIVTVDVLDVNDNKPQFAKRRFYANISEDAPVGTFVFRIEASDVDQGENGNLTFVLPEGDSSSTSSMFRVNGKSGEIFTGALMDREKIAVMELTVFVRDGGNPPLFDVATVVVTLLDINDNAPTFAPSSCGVLHVPENSDPAVVHTVLAVDADDSAKNGLLSYSITGGNEGKEFTIDPSDGRLSVGRLDRETKSSYRLEITARDGGSPSLSAKCNLTVHVLDENDNDPVFPQPRYHATLPEDALPGSSVIHVRASDLDAGLNSRITYSFTNETHSLFAIHNESGLVTTTGTFDREKQGVYSFHVRATDAGQYNARWEEVEVQVTISDVNDHAPEFTEYPFITHVPASVDIDHELLKVKTHDPDDGINAAVTYRLAKKHPLFDIEAETGIIRATSSLRSESNKLFQLEVIATDGGFPANSATGLVEIHVADDIGGNSGPRLPTLRFTSPYYDVMLNESAAAGTEVVQVSAVRSDGRRQKITYRFGRGNEDNAFEINSNNGLIRVRDSNALDHETNPEIRLVVMARTDGVEPVFGYAAVTVRLVDMNDNSPRFTQDDYSAVAWEGNAKGTFVTKILATDKDSGSNARLSYHIVDGNQDNAFLIEPPYSGEVRTNIVLDREIRDSYLLTVIATDEGSPQRTGTCTLKVNIVDVNDNQPTFPPTSLVSISESAQVGTVVMTVTANDVDTNPMLTYSFVDEASDSKNSNEGVKAADVEAFTLDRFTGRLLLAKALDYEAKQTYRLKISASDSVNTATTILTVEVNDENDNPPQFMLPAYMASVSVNSKAGTSVVQLSATDRDSDINGKIKYSIKRNRWSDMFHVDPETGTLYVNKTLSRVAKPVARLTSALPRAPLPSVMRLVVVATDGGKPALSSSVPVHIHVKRAFGVGGTLAFPKRHYTVGVSEDTPKGSTVLKLEAGESHSIGLGADLCCIHYWMENSTSIVGETFQVMSSSGELVLLKTLDREKQQNYTLTVSASDRLYPEDKASTKVTVNVEDANDSPPVFRTPLVNITIPESTVEGTVVATMVATDADSSSVVYDFLSGNDRGYFQINTKSGVVKVAKKLDYETQKEHRLVVRARDGINGTAARASVATLFVALEDVNEFGPEFPAKVYHAYLAENARPGTEVAQLKAIDGDGGIFGKVNYTLSNGDSNWFTIQADSGIIFSQKVMDYEDGKTYKVTVTATDTSGATATAKVMIHVESRDEYPPEFIQDHYAFAAPAEIPFGYVIGQVQATDQDKGVDGVVIYDVDNQQKDLGFTVNVTTGAVMAKRDLELADGTELKMRVVASSGQAGSLKGHATVNIKVDKNLSVVGLTSKADSAPEAGLAPWALALVIILALVASLLSAAILIIRWRSNARRKHKPPSHLTGEVNSAANLSGGPDHHYDTAFDPLDICGSGVCPAAALDGTASDRGSGNPYSIGFGPDFNVSAYETASAGAGSTLKHHLHLHHQVGAHHGSGMVGNSNHSEGSLSGSASSGRGSAGSGDGDPEDAEIRMINEGPLRLSMPDSGLQDEDNMSDTSVQNTQEYLARLGIVDNPQGSEHGRAMVEDVLDAHMEHLYDNDVGPDADISQLLGGGGGSANVSVSGSNSGVVSVPVVGQPSMTGSLSSIVHSEEELTGSYNWDYLLDWGPQYQPLAHVFAEIARLKDDSGPPSSSSAYGSGAPVVVPPPPPLLTSVAPPTAARANQLLSMSHGLSIPIARSPINVDDSTLAAAALSPSFSPALSPLDTRSPSMSPLTGPSGPRHHLVSQQRFHPTSTLSRDSEFRI